MHELIGLPTLVAIMVLALAFGHAFHHIANTLVDAFCSRARDLYGASQGL